MANCVNKSLKEVKELASKFKLTPDEAAIHIAVWQDNNFTDRFPNEEEFKGTLISESKNEDKPSYENSIINKEFQRLNSALGGESVTSLNDALNDTTVNTDYIDNQVSKKLKLLLERIGIDYKNVDRIIDSNGNPINAVAKADIFNKTIEVIEELRDITTLPEETAHFYVELLGKDNPLFKQMMDKIERFDIYTETYNKYKDIPGYSDEMIKKEAIGKLISINVINNQALEESALRQDLFTKWWNKTWNWIKDRLGLLKASETTPFVKAAKDMLEGKIDNLLTLDQVIDYNADSNGMSYYQVSNDDIVDRDTLIESLELNPPIRNFETGGWETRDGRKIKTDVDTWVLAKNRKKISDKDVRVAAKAGYIGAINSSIMNELNKDITAEQIKNDEFRGELLDRVANQMLRNSEYRDIYEGNEKYFNITPSKFNESVEAMNDIYSAIAENNLRIERLSGQSLGKRPKIFTDIAVYNEQEDTAASVDLMVVYPNNTIGIYQYKGISLYEKGGQVPKDARIRKSDLEIFDSEVVQIKKILKMQYGLTKDNFAETRIVPMQIRLNSKSEIVKLQIGDKDGNRDYLTQIPVADELTEDKELNKSLEKMFNLRQKYKKALKEDFKDEKTQTLLEELNRNITNIQLNRDVTFTYTEIANMLNRLQASESAPKNSPNKLTVADLNDYLEFAEIYKDFYINSKKTTTLLQPDKVELLQRIPKMIEDINNITLNKLIEYLDEGKDVSIASGILQTGNLGSWMKQLRDFDQPTFQRMAELVKLNSENTRNSVNEVIKIAKEQHNKIGKWAKNNNISVLEAFEKIYNKKTGKLVAQFSSKYFSDLKAARGTKDKKWMDKYTLFDEVSYEKNKNSYFEFLDRRYPEEEQNELKQERKDNYIKKYDIRQNSEALFNYNNYYVRLKDTKEYHSSEWKELSKESNQPLKEYYEFYIKTMEDLSETVGKKLERGFVPEIKQDLIDRFAHIGPGAFTELISHMLNALEIREYDISNREIDAEGKPLPVIPLFLTDQVREGLNDKEKKNLEDKLKSEGLELGSIPYKLELDKRTLSLEFEKGRELKSFDLTKSLILFAEAAYTYQNANETEDAVRAIRNIMKSNRIKTTLTDTIGRVLKNKTTQEATEIEGMSNRDIDAFDRFVNMYWYGLFTQNKDLALEIRGKKISVTKAAKMILKYTGLNAMAFKPVLAAGNAIGLLTSSYMMAAEGRIYTKNQFSKGLKMVLKDKAELKKQTLSKAFRSYFEISSRDLTYEKANALSASELVKKVTLDNAYVLHKHPDDIVEEAILLAMAQNHGISEDGSIKRLARLPEGTKSLLDSTTFKNDKLIIPGITDNSENYQTFRQYVRTQSTKVKGSIPDDNKNTLATNIFYQAMMQFRNWIPGTAKTRFGGYSIDPDMKELDVGRFRVITGEFLRSSNVKEVLGNFKNLLGETLLSAPLVDKFRKKSVYDSKQSKKAAEFFYKKFKAENPNMAKDVSFEEFKELRAAKLKGFAKELSMLLSFMTLVSLLKSLIPDDDEEKFAQYLAKNTYMAANRGLMELQFWFSPTTVEDLMGSTLPSFRTFVKVQKALKNTADVFGDVLLQKKGETAIFSKDKKDKTPFGYYSTGLIPGVSALTDFLDIYDKPVNFTK